MLFYKIYRSVESTHKGLGKYYLLALCSLLAGRGVILVGEQGSGKSAIAVSLLNLLSSNKIYTGLVRDSITLHGLLLDKKIQNIPDPLILVDDYSSSGTYYAKVQLWSALTQLSWYKTFSVSKKDLSTTVEFDKFNFIVCIQPSWLDTVLNLEEWTGLIHDKSVRIYIVNLVKKPTLHPPNVNYKIQLYDVEVPKTIKHSGYWKQSIMYLTHVYSLARATDLAQKLLKNIVCLYEANEIKTSHLKILLKFSKLIALESYLIEGESAKRFNQRLFRLLNMFTKYKEFTTGDFSREFKINYYTASEILNSKDCLLYIHKERGVFKPLPELLKILNLVKW